MELTRSIFGLLTWQWVVLILGFSFRAPLRRLIDRVIGVSFGGKKGIRVTADQFGDRGREMTPERVPAAGISKVVEAERFVLRDAGGKVRAILGLSDTDSAALSLRDREGKERAALYVTAHGPSALDFCDEKGATRVMLGLGDEYLALVLKGSSAQSMASLAVDEKGDPNFEGVNSSGVAVWSIP
ncbi:MAG: hypothetical protein WA005_15750 [Candidatus Binataceae bacterium]